MGVLIKIKYFKEVFYYKLKKVNYMTLKIHRYLGTYTNKISIQSQQYFKKQLFYGKNKAEGKRTLLKC